MNHRKTISEVWGAECTGQMLITVAVCSGVCRRSTDKFSPLNRPHFLVSPSLHSVFGSVRRRHLKQCLVWGLNQQRSELHFKVFSDSLLLLVPSPLDPLPAWNAGMRHSLKLWSHGLFPPVVPSRRNLVSWIWNSKAKVREKITVALNNEQKHQEIYFPPHSPLPHADILFFKNSFPKWVSCWIDSPAKQHPLLAYQMGITNAWECRLSLGSSSMPGT